MKWLAEFNLPDDRVDFLIHKDASKFYGVLWDIEQELRKKVRYGDAKERVSWETVQEEFFKLMQDAGVNLDDYA